MSTTLKERPVGPPVDASPAQRPGPVTLTGRFGTVTHLDTAAHAAGLWEAMRGHDSLWDYLPAGPFTDAPTFTDYIESCEQHAERCFYAVMEGNQPVGMLSLMEIRPAQRTIEVGNIVYSPALQRRPIATEAQYLIARYAFETLRYRRYEWKCNALNAASWRAALRFGFSHEGVFRQHMIVKGRNRDTAWFSILDSEWPARKQAFETWLAPENFDAAGTQRVSLAVLNGAVR